MNERIFVVRGVYASGRRPITYVGTNQYEARAATQKLRESEQNGRIEVWCDGEVERVQRGFTDE